MITHIRHSGIATDDLDASQKFYESMGFKVSKKMEETGPFIETILKLKGVHVTTVKMSADDGNLIELLYFNTHSGKKVKREMVDIGLTHLAFTVDDVENDYERLQSKGIEFYSPPQKNPEGTVKVAFCEDPHGNIMELVQVL
tara:strand:+ start:23 stop:448 length:426 start_codon:yes stop_codon:yes gene_type:complete